MSAQEVEVATKKAKHPAIVAGRPAVLDADPVVQDVLSGYLMRLGGFLEAKILKAVEDGRDVRSIQVYGEARAHFGHEMRRLGRGGLAGPLEDLRAEDRRRWSAEPSLATLLPVMTGSERFLVAKGGLRRTSGASGAGANNSFSKYQYHLTKMELLDGLGHLPSAVVENGGVKLLAELRVVIYPMTVNPVWKKAFHRVFLFLNTRPKVTLGDNPKLANSLVKAVRHLCSHPPVPKGVDFTGPTQDELSVQEVGLALRQLMARDRLKGRELAARTLTALRDAEVLLDGSGQVKGLAEADLLYEFGSGTLDFKGKRRRFYAGKSFTRPLFELLLEHQDAGLARIRAVDFLKASTDAYALTGDPDERLIGALREINDTNGSNGIPLRVKLEKGSYRLNRPVKIIRTR